MLGDLLLRQSPENPSTSLANPASWLFTALGGSTETYTGKRVSEATALNFSAYWACVRVKSETIAQVPAKVFAFVDGGGGRVEAREHPLWRVIHDRPNPELTSFHFRELLMSHLMTWGNFYAEVVRGPGRQVAELWPMLPDRTRVVRRGGAKILVTQVDGVDVALRPGSYMHIPGMGYDGLQGYSPIRVYAKQTLALGMAAEEYGSRWFGGGGKPPLVVKTVESLTDEARERAAAKLSHIHGSLTKAQRTMILDEGWDIENIGVPNDDAQFLQTRKFQVEEMARVFRIQLHKLQSMDRATFDNIEQQSIEFVTDCIAPEATRIEQVMSHDLVREDERGSIFVELNLDGLLRGDFKTRQEGLAVQRQWGIINTDEWRKFEGKNPIGGAAGETYFVPMNMMPADQAAAGLPETEDVPPPPDDEPEPEEEASRSRATGQPSLSRAQRRSALSRHRLMRSMMGQFQRAAEHFVLREARAAARIVKRAWEGATPAEDALRELSSLWEDLPAAIRREFLPVLRALAAMVSAEVVDEVGSDPQAAERSSEEMADAYVETFTLRHIGSSENQVRKIIAEAEAEEARDALLARFEQWAETRAQRIARAETVQAVGAFSRAAYIVASVLVLRWVAMGENCPLCDAMNGRTTSIREVFLARGDVVDPGVEGTAPLEVKGGSIGHPPLHNGCDCMIVAG